MSKPWLSIDVESRSPVDLKKSGVYRYWEHPYTEILCAAWAIDQAPAAIWYPGDPCPPDVAGLVEAGGSISGWNVNFERQGWNRLLGPRHGWPVPRLEQFHDTAAQAAAQALPRGLEQAAWVLKLSAQKDKAGSALMMRMARPRKPHKGEPPQKYYWYEGDLGRLGEYCRQDVEVERAIRNKLQPLSGAERDLWLFDQLINDRGITLDRDLVEDMRSVVTSHTEALDRKMAEVTCSYVTACSQTERLKKWLSTHQVEVKSLAKGAIDMVLNTHMPMQCMEAVCLWHEASKASVRKLNAADACVTGDRRAHGLLLFHGATSGRWAGQLFQPQNLPRGSGLVEDQDTAIDLIRQKHTGCIEWAYGNPLIVVSDCLRGVMTAAPGKVLMAGDFASVEARITAWLAGDEGKLDQFRKGEDVYVNAAARIYNRIPSKISKAERQIGKTAELSLGFGGGVDALARMAISYGVSMHDAYGPLWEAASVEDREKVEARFEDVSAKGNSGRLNRESWIASALTVKAWRRAHPKIVEMWHDCHRAAWNCLEQPEQDHFAGKLSFRRDKGFLWLTLPSGRKLAYPTPAKENLEVPWSDKTLPSNKREHRDMLTVLAFEKKKAFRYAFYPGITFQHSVQAIARDLLANGMLNVEAAGFPVVMSIHDEVIVEVNSNQGIGLSGFLDALCRLPAWAEGLPLIADGWSGFRYRKS